MIKTAALLDHYSAQRQAGQTPHAAFAAANSLRWVKTSAAYKVDWPQPLRPHFSEAEMTAIAATPVVLIDSRRLPHNYMGNSCSLAAEQADERNEGMNRQLKHRGIQLSPFITFETAGDHVGACCYHFGKEVSPSAALHQLISQGREALSTLPAGLHGDSRNRNRLTVMLLPGLDWHPASTWLDYLAGGGVRIERLPLSSDKSLILQLHEMGHTRQHILIGHDTNTQHRHEIEADDYAYKSYALLEGPAGTIAASKAATALMNFLRFRHLRLTHLTAPHVCLPDAGHLFTDIRAVRLGYKKLEQRVAQHLAAQRQGKNGGSARLRALHELWNSKAKLTSPELMIAGLTLEAANLYCPRLLRPIALTQPTAR